MFGDFDIAHKIFLFHSLVCLLEYPVPLLIHFHWASLSSFLLFLKFLHLLPSDNPYSRAKIAFIKYQFHCITAGLKNLKWLFACSPGSHMWLWRPLTDLIIEFILDIGPSRLFFPPVSYSRCLFCVFRFLTVSGLFFLKKYLWDIFEVWDEGNFLWQSLVFAASAGGTAWLVDDMVFDDKVLLYPCYSVNWAGNPWEAWASGDCSSGMGFFLHCAQCQYSFSGRGLAAYSVWLTHDLKNSPLGLQFHEGVVFYWAPCLRTIWTFLHWKP